MYPGHDAADRNDHRQHGQCQPPGLKHVPRCPGDGRCREAVAAGHTLPGLILGEKRREPQRCVGARAVNGLAHQRPNQERRRRYDERGPELPHAMPDQPGQHTEITQVDQRHRAAADDPQRHFSDGSGVEPPDNGAVLLSIHRGILPLIIIKNKKKVNIIVKRDNKEKEITLKQHTVVIPSVSSRIVESNNKKVGVLNGSIFAANTYKQFKNKLDDLENKKIDSLIIDVRQNSGGHLDQVSKILSLFMKQDKVIYQIKTKKGVEKYYSTGKKSKNYNVVVLIDNGSASASEILAAAMNESYGATLIGEKTYGKGTVQKEYMLSSGASIKYTVEKWFTPKGKSINGKGISPTIEVALSDEYTNNPTDENDNQLQEAIKFLTEEKKTN